MSNLTAVCAGPDTVEKRARHQLDLRFDLRTVRDLRLAKKVKQKLILKRSKEVSKRFHENFLSKGFQVKLLLNQNTSFLEAHSTVLDFKCRLLSTDFFVVSGLTSDR